MTRSIIVAARIIEGNLMNDLGGGEVKEEESIDMKLRNMVIGMVESDKIR